MPGLVPGICVFKAREAWMAGSSPAMTMTKADFVAGSDPARAFFDRTN